MHAAFSPTENKFVTVGPKHVKFWSVETKSDEAGIFNGKGEQTSFACVAYDD
jgi:hypothetical protein